MAVFKNSTFGKMRKGIGDDVTYISGGQNIVRKKPAFVNDAKTQAQLNQRSVFALMVLTFRQLSGIVKLNFNERLAKLSAFNVFMSLNLRHAVQMVNGVATIRWDKFLISKGSLPVVKNAVITSNADGTVSLETTSQVDGNLLYNTDKLKIVILSTLNPSLSIIKVFDAKDDLQEQITLGKLADEPSLIAYLLHATANNSKTSDSVSLPVIL